ncbi:MAG: hypothetical protein ACRDNZ_03470 [Streptosporangiaceae bacterium]
MKSVTPYLFSAALILPPSSATYAAIPEYLPASHVLYYVESSSQVDIFSYISFSMRGFSTDSTLNFSEIPAILGPAHEVGYISESYEPFTVVEAWREIPTPEAPVKVVYEGRPASFLDAHDLAAIAIYE